MRVTLRVRPGARQAAVGGVHDGALVIAVNAPALEGRATAAALKALAKELGLPSSAVRLVHGATSRTKVVELPDSAREQVEKLLARRRGASGPER